MVLDFHAVDSVLSSPETPAMHRKKVSRLGNAAAEMLAAAEDMDGSFWYNIFMDADDLPMEKRLKIHDGNMDTLLGMTPLIAATAKRMCESPRKTRTGPSPNRNMAIARFACGLIPYYEDVTGKKANAYSSPNATGLLAPRAGPFVCFVAACLKPVCPEAINRQLGEIIHRQIFLPARKAATK